MVLRSADRGEKGERGDRGDRGVTGYSAALSLPVVVIVQVAAAIITVTGTMAVMRSEIDMAKTQLSENRAIQVEVLQRVSRMEATIDGLKDAVDRQSSIDSQLHYGAGAVNGNRGSGSGSGNNGRIK